MSLTFDRRIRTRGKRPTPGRFRTRVLVGCKNANRDLRDHLAPLLVTDFGLTAVVFLTRAHARFSGAALGDLVGRRSPVPATQGL